MIEGKAIGIAHAVAVNLVYLARALERIARRNPVLAVGTDRIRTGGQSRIERIESQEFSERRGQVLGVAAGFDVTWSNVIGIAAISQGQIHIAVGTEGECAAVVVGGVLAERDNFPARRGIDNAGIGGRNFPFVDDVSIGVRGGRRHGISGQGAGGNDFAVVSVERAIAGAVGIIVAGMKSEPEKTASSLGLVGTSGVLTRL